MKLSDYNQMQKAWIPRWIHIDRWAIDLIPRWSVLRHGAVV